MDNKIKEKIFKEIKGVKCFSNMKNIPEKARNLAEFLTEKYGFYDVTFITSRVYNIFMLAMDNQNRMLFIKSGRHPELYRNEYIMGRALWNIDNTHFLEPLYYSDSGDFFFFANEIMNGTSLQIFKDSGKLKKMPATDKMGLIRDLYQIFKDLKNSDVVHRDIRPANFAVMDNRLILIDFQLAVSKSNYIELPSMSATRLRGLGIRKYRHKLWQWDDSYSLLQCLRFIGCPGKQYQSEYNKIYHEIKSYIGHDVIKSEKTESAWHRLWRHLTKKRKK